MARPRALRVDRVSKSFAGVRVLDDVSLLIPEGQVHALLGGNGSGKSTLIKILAGVQPADGGSGTLAAGDLEIAADHVTPGWARSAQLSFVHQELGLIEQVSVAENLVVAGEYRRSGPMIRWRRTMRAAAEALEQRGLRIAPETLVRDLRPSERTLVAIARALQGRDESHAGVLVLDEPTARLPAGEVEALLAALQEYARAGQTILFVSHRLDEVLRLADAVTVLRAGRVAMSREVAGLTEDELVTAIVGQRVERLVADAPDAAPASGAPVLGVTGLSAGPIRDLSFELRAGEVLGVAGLVGSGRTSVLETLFGARPRAAGSVSVDGRPLRGGSVAAAVAAGIGYVPEDRLTHAAFAELGIAENLTSATLASFARHGVFDRRAERRESRAAMARFDIRASTEDVPMGRLSGGNQQKVVMARWLRARPRILLLDEPTQGVDVGARADLYAVIRELCAEGSAVLLVSSDFDELARLADRVVVLAGGRVAAFGAGADVTQEWVHRNVYERAA